MGLISLVLNITQGHKRSYETSPSINAKSLGTISARMFQFQFLLRVFYKSNLLIDAA